jgi:hypothetical protein
MSYHVIFVCVCVRVCVCARARICVSACVPHCALLRVRVRACSARSIHERGHAVPSIGLLRIVSQHAPRRRMSRRASSGQLPSPFRLPLCSYQISVTTGDVRYAGMRGHTTRRPTRAHPHRLPSRLARSCIPVEPRTRPMVDQSVAVVSMHVVRAGPSRVFTPAAAGTDANVRCQLVGAKSTSALLYLQKSNHLNKFERGQACKRPLPLQMPSYTAFPLVRLISHGFKFWVTSLPHE